MTIKKHGVHTHAKFITIMLLIEQNPNVLFLHRYFLAALFRQL